MLSKQNGDRIVESHCTCDASSRAGGYKHQQLAYAHLVIYSQSQVPEWSLPHFQVLYKLLASINFHLPHVDLQSETGLYIFHIGVSNIAICLCKAGSIRILGVQNRKVMLDE